MMVAMLIAVVAWLVLSYWPAAAAALPTLAFGPGADAALAALTVAVLLLTAAIQLWIVYSTLQPLRKPDGAAMTATVRQFNLSLPREALLTAAPLLITALLAVLIFA